MKNTALFFLVLLFSVAVPFGSFCKGTAITEWAPYSGIEGFSFKGEVLTFNSKSSLPLLASKNDIFINASRQKTLEIRMKSDKSYMTGRLFFRRIGDSDFNFNNSFEFQAGLNNMYHKYLINLSRNPNWFGTVTQLMLSPINSDGKVEIESVNFLEPTIFLMAKSYGQEFLTLERPVPHTINFIFGPRINGISVNAYIYSLIILASLILIAVYWVKFYDLGILLKTLPFKIILVCLFFWVLLDARTAIDQIRYMIIDHQTFGGRSLEEKQALSTNGGFYDFYYYLKFCREKIPSGSSYSLVVPNNAIYFIDKSRYFLCPTYEKTTEAQYVLVYDPQNMVKAQDIPAKGYKKYADFGNNRYVLKRTVIL